MLFHSSIRLYLVLRTLSKNNGQVAEIVGSQVGEDLSFDNTQPSHYNYRIKPMR